MGWGAFHFALIALVTLPLAGTPFAIWLLIFLNRHYVPRHPVSDGEVLAP